ncbi:alpha/beta fold hydrolase [Jiangella anatolica]|uniref:Alpha/beta hydrolase n=1 Tax=Jiangella anatolica TaxID=2670374 RepID=A0A2W2BER4_9ACTN|nr:alpha/beta fold hydrolase [Jiangella anatolica]PZF85615.1 alpha/beta hydrolase [Jiangella anatolica]
MTPELALTRLGGAENGRPLLVVGPSLGTSVAALWDRCARLLADRFDVIGWDLPGHGSSRPAAGPFTVAELADAVRAAAVERAAGRPVAYAGVSLGGAVAFELATRPEPFGLLVAVASAPRIGEPASWHERAALVRRAGTPVMVESSARRWFAPDFTERDPSTAGALLTSLAQADRWSYAWACEALAAFDRSGSDGAGAVPLHVVAGEHDPVVPPAAAERIPATAVRVLPGCGHLPPAEVPDAMAGLLAGLLLTREATP